MSQYSPYPQLWHEESNGGKSATSPPAFNMKIPMTPLEDSRYGQEDQNSRCVTPSMTRGSSRSTQSEIGACGCPSGHCVCRADSESLRSQSSEVDMISGSVLTRTPEIRSTRILLQKPKERFRYPPILIPDRIGLCSPLNATSRATALSVRPSGCSGVTSRVDQVRAQENGQYDQCKTSPNPSLAPDALRSAAPTVEQLKLRDDKIAEDNSDSENAEDDDENDEYDDSDNDDDNWSGQDGNLEARVIQAVDNDLPLAAALISFLHKAIFSEFATNITRKVGPWRYGVTKCPTEAGASSSQNAPSSNAATNISGNASGKRQRKYGENSFENRGDEDAEEDEEDDDDEKDPKRIKGDTDAATVSHYPRLACPFHKKDPLKYRIQHVVENGKRPDYRTCAGPGFKNIQRVREHLRRKHYPVQCDRCYFIFEGPDRAALVCELQNHRQLPDPCQRNPSSLREGISESQMAILEKKSGNKRMNKIQVSSNIDKWNEIWTTLFPESPIPQTPWYDRVQNESPPHSPSLECNQFLELFHAILDHKTKQGDIRLEEGMRPRFMDMAKQAFDLWSSTRRACENFSSTNSSSARTYPQTTPLSSSYQIVNHPRGSGRHHTSAGASSAAIQSDAFSMDISTGSPVVIKSQRHQSDNSSHSMPPLFAAVSQASHPSYGQEALDSYATDGQFVAEHMINNEYPFGRMDGLGSGAEPWGYDATGNVFDSGNGTAGLSNASFANSTGSVNPAQLLRSPADRTHGLPGNPAEWMQYTNTGRPHYGAGN